MKHWFVAMLLLSGCAANPADKVPSAQVGSASPGPVSVTSTPASPAPAASSVRLALDPSNSKVGFVGSKVTGSHEGGFKEVSGTIELVDNDPTRSKVQVDIKVSSMFTDDNDLTEHLLSPDFFDAKQFPQATFVSKAIEKSSAGFEVVGDLSMHGTTREIRFPAQIQASPSEVKVTSEFSINRFDFGMKYPGKADNLIRKEVVIKLDVVAKPSP